MSNTFISWEKAESKLHREAVIRALSKAQKSPADVDVIFAGDLLSQCIGTCFGIRELDMPFAGLYGACSTMALSLLMASVFIDTGTAGLAVASTSSHFCSAEKQFRLPLEYGGQRPPSAQWTATAAGAAVLASSGEGPRVESVIIGKMQDLGIKDANNMGAAWRRRLRIPSCAISKPPKLRRNSMTPSSPAIWASWAANCSAIW